MVNFAELKKNRANGLSNLKDAIAPKKASFTNHDEKCWKPTIDKSGIGYARIRFLAAPTFLDPNERDFVKLDSFNVKKMVDGKARYYIENSLTTVGPDGKRIAEKDPANELKWALWNLGDQESKDLSRGLKNRTQYYSNVYIIEDAANPENVGRVLPYKYGAQIFEKIENAISPKFPNDPVFNPFDMWEGRDFIVKAVIDPGSKLPDYSGSAFDGVSAPLFDSDDDIERIWLQQESLLSWIGPDRFKTAEELEKRLRYVYGFATLAERDGVAVADGDFHIDPPQQAPVRTAPPARTPGATASPARSAPRTPDAVASPARPAPVTPAASAAPVTGGVDLQSESDFLNGFDFNFDDE